MRSRRFTDLDRPHQKLVLRACVTDDDLGALCPVRVEERVSALSAPVLRRARLRRACSTDAELARRLGDRLDLAHLEMLLLVASLDHAEIEERVQAWIARPNGRTLPGLLWALLTDGRNKVHALGVRLAHEAQAEAIGRFVR